MHVFIFYGQSPSGKSILANLIDTNRVLEPPMFLPSQEKGNMIVDDFICSKKDCKELVLNIDPFFRKLHHLKDLENIIIITCSDKETIEKELISRLKLDDNTLITLCEFTKY